MLRKEALFIRDVIHGTIAFTKYEKSIINHPLFQRLRNVRQNDVAYMVYPSLNTTRFEHVLGVVHVAGAMAQCLHENASTLWHPFAEGMRGHYGLRTSVEFEQLVRFYALFHDIGHFPFSHLFEMALAEYAASANTTRNSLMHDWFGYGNDIAPHEAFGAKLVDHICRDRGIPRPYRRALLELMTNEHLPLTDPISVAKAIISGGLGADRADAYKRDGLAGGGEYGNFDIERLINAPRLWREENGDWRVYYNEKSLSAMEGIYLDRMHTYVWMHYHHATITMKVLMRYAIVDALKTGVLTKADFPLDDIDTLSQRDDSWLVEK